MKWAGIAVSAFQARTHGSRSTRSLLHQSPLLFSSPSENNSGDTNGPESSNEPSTSKKKRLLVLGGTGFLGGTICNRAKLEGYHVTSLSRRGVPPFPSSTSSQQGQPTSTSSTTPSTTTVSSNSGINRIDYRRGDARQPDTVRQILAEHDDYVGVVHAIGLLFDDASGLGNYNQFVSGSGSVPDESSTYDAITRQSAFYAIDAAIEYAQKRKHMDGEGDGVTKRFPFIFISAAEAGWPDVPGGQQVEQFLAPEWLKRYLEAKRKVESKLLSSSDGESIGESIVASDVLRPIIPRPSLIYSLDRPASYLPVGAFFVGNRVGLPFVDRPVTVQALSNAIVRSINPDSSVEGILRYERIDELSQ
eukprot:CAMPEP_0113503572 /NCGR_PEP_ID=MMETSP0014_2-20120614/34231_1 /TAXON_ID=2857 /ORGANISM="Nitzschia sp." /LENGTH=360 /DNA_ID=CAMNT_0000398579 /DNA_START=29 /DNA_END=1111 /DNA_ORIENTATION=+ /assembly_acc=CAM_ASM_000159